MANKATITEDVVKELGLSKKDAAKAVDVVFDSIKKSLGEKEAVRVIGFGTFDVKGRKARKGRNPQTGEELEIEATVVPKFKASKELKKQVAK